jgi:hypothetical protein
VIRPNFSGLWQANLLKSRSSAPAPAKLMMKIAHGEDDLKQAVLVTRSNGTQERQVLTYSMTDEQLATELRGSPIKLRVRWNGPEMVIEATYGESVFRDYWSLSDDGRTLTMAHRDDPMAGQITVLERAEHL